MYLLKKCVYPSFTLTFPSGGKELEFRITCVLFLVVVVFVNSALQPNSAPTKKPLGLLCLFSFIAFDGGGYLH